MTPPPSPSPDTAVVGKVGRVTGQIEPGEIGEVMLPIRGGSEAFHAYAAEADEVIEVGSRVIVIDFDPPRAVYVTRFSGVA